MGRVTSPAARQDEQGLKTEARSDKELVYAARAGDVAAFDGLFYRYRDGVFRLGLALTKDPSTADEVVVDTFARAYRSLLRLEPERSLRPWLYRVAVNLAYNRRPRKGLTFSPLESASEEALVNDERSPSSLAELAELRPLVIACLDTLGPKHRVVVVLHYLNGLNLAEIAEVVDCPVGTVKSRLHYALLRLRTYFVAHPELGFEPSGPSAATPNRMAPPMLERAARELE